MNCRVCGHEKLEELYVKELEYGYMDTFKYLYCPACGCVQIQEIPKNLEKYYPPNYYSFNNKTKSQFLPKKMLRKVRNEFCITHNKKNFVGYLLSKLFPCDTKLNVLNKAVPEINKIKGNVKLLDVGCGNGDFLLTLEEVGFKNLYGLDPYIDKTKKIGNNILLYKSRLLDHNENRKYDIITFNHSFEHLTENHFKILQKVKNLLSKNGKCIIRMPTTSSFAWEYYKENWVGLQAPRHIIIYSVRGFEILASNSGFHIDSISYDSTEFSFLASEQYKKNIVLNSDISFHKNFKKSIFKKEDVLKYRKLAKQLNAKCRGDMICVILRKNGNL